MGRWEAQQGLSGCWRCNHAVPLLYTRLGWVQPGLGAGAPKVSADLSATPEITLQLAGIFTLLFSFLLFLSQGERVKTRGLREQKSTRTKPPRITILLAGAMMLSPSDEHSWS